MGSTWSKNTAPAAKKVALKQNKTKQNNCGKTKQQQNKKQNNCCQAAGCPLD
jgi:hypothetical protein